MVSHVAPIFYLASGCEIEVCGKHQTNQHSASRARCTDVYIEQFAGSPKAWFDRREIGFISKEILEKPLNELAC